MENKCPCCGSKNLTEVNIYGQKYKVCQDCLDERTIKNLNSIGGIDDI